MVNKAETPPKKNLSEEIRALISEISSLGFKPLILQSDITKEDLEAILELLNSRPNPYNAIVPTIISESATESTETLDEQADNALPLLASINLPTAGLIIIDKSAFIPTDKNYFEECDLALKSITSEFKENLRISFKKVDLSGQFPPTVHIDTILESTDRGERASLAIESNTHGSKRAQQEKSTLLRVDQFPEIVIERIYSSDVRVGSGNKLTVKKCEKGRIFIGSSVLKIDGPVIEYAEITIKSYAGITGFNAALIENDEEKLPQNNSYTLSDADYYPKNSFSGVVAINLDELDPNDFFEINIHADDRASVFNPAPPVIFLQSKETDPKKLKAIVEKITLNNITKLDRINFVTNNPIIRNILLKHGRNILKQVGTDGYQIISQSNTKTYNRETYREITERVENDPNGQSYSRRNSVYREALPNRKNITFSSEVISDPTIEHMWKILKSLGLESDDLQ